MSIFEDMTTAVLLELLASMLFLRFYYGPLDAAPTRVA